MTAILTATGIRKSYRTGAVEQTVLADLSVAIGAGEFVAVMGTSGSGKSTMLFALSGLEAVDAGEIEFEGRALAGLSENAKADLRRTRMGFVFQQPTLLRTLTIADNIMLPTLRDRHGDRRPVAERARALMAEVGIADLADRGISEVSGGQAQRAGICRALMGEPAMIFADEPTGALNSQSSAEIMALFGRINQQGTAILVVTHDAQVAAEAHRVLFMDDGRIVEELVLGDAEGRTDTEGSAHPEGRAGAEKYAVTEPRADGAGHGRSPVPGRGTGPGPARRTEQVLEVMRRIGI